MENERFDCGPAVASHQRTSVELHRQLAEAADAASFFEILLRYCNPRPERIALVPVRAPDADEVVCITYLPSPKDQSAACQILGATPIGSTGFMLCVKSATLKMERISYWRDEDAALGTGA